MLAHQGGWDEILLVAGPIAVIVIALWRATRHASRDAGTTTPESRPHPDH
ncbi:MAG: hypothetical protein ACKORC_03210 [Acidimicrobiia bacterium]